MWADEALLGKSTHCSVLVAIRMVTHFLATNKHCTAANLDVLSQLQDTYGTRLVSHETHSPQCIVQDINGKCSHMYCYNQTQKSNHN